MRALPPGRRRTLGQHASTAAKHPAPGISLGLSFQPARPADAGRSADSALDLDAGAAPSIPGN